MTARIPGKKQVLLAFLERGVAMVHLDARRPGVKVPLQHRNEAHLRLNLSYRYRIPDFEIGEEGVQATLSFGGQSFLCVLPWPAIFGITSEANGDGQVWPEDLPVEVTNATESPVPPPQMQAPPLQTRRPALAAVESEGPGAEPREQSSKPQDGGTRRHLRLVR